MFSFKCVFEELSGPCQLCFSPDTNSIYYLASGHVIAAIDYKTKEKIFIIDLPAFIFELTVTQCGGFLLVGCGDNIGRVVDTKTKKMIALNGHTNTVRCIIECEDTDVLTCSDDTTIRRWNRLTGECIRTYTGHSDWIRSIIYDRKTNRIFSGSDDHTIITLNAETGEQIGVMKGHSCCMTSLAFVNATTIVSGCADKTVKIWDITTMKEIKTMSSHTDWVRSIAVTPDRQHVVSGSNDKTVKVWSIETGECIETVSDIGDYVRNLQISQDGKYVFVSLYLGYKIYEIEPAFSCVVHKFNAQVGMEHCMLNLLSDGSIFNEKGEKI